MSGGVSEKNEIHNANGRNDSEVWSKARAKRSIAAHLESICIARIRPKEQMPMKDHSFILAQLFWSSPSLQAPFTSFPCTSRGRFLPHLLLTPIIPLMSTLNLQKLFSLLVLFVSRVNTLPLNTVTHKYYTSYNELFGRDDLEQDPEAKNGILAGSVICGVGILGLLVMLVLRRRDSPTPLASNTDEQGKPMTVSRREGERIVSESRVANQPLFPSAIPNPLQSHSRHGASAV